MKRFTACVTLLALLAPAVPAWAADAVVPAPSMTPVISPLKQGQVAPYAGVLLSPGAVAQLVAQQDTVQAAIQLVVQHQVEVDAAQQKYALDTQQTTCDADKKVLQAQVDDGKRQVVVLTDQLKKNTGGPGAPVWIGVGVVGGIVLTVLTTFAITRVTK
jgi:sensor c-di-GMP phosphodiesterase-like protein